MGTSATVDLTTDQDGTFVAPVLPIGSGFFGSNRQVQFALKYIF